MFVYSDYMKKRLENGIDVCLLPFGGLDTTTPKLIQSNTPIPQEMPANTSRASQQGFFQSAGVGGLSIKSYKTLFVCTLK